MATKTKRTTKKSNKTSVVKKINTGLINASIAAINTTVDNGEKWQKLASKLIKKTEKVREQQINMIFDTAEAVKGQFMVGADRMKDLVGYDQEMLEKAKDMATNNPVSRKVVEIIEDITEKVSENPMVQKAEKATEDIKNKGIAKFNDLKEDVLEQASKIIDKGEAIIEEAKTTPKAKVTKVSTSSITKTAPKKAVAKKVTVTKIRATKIVAKATPKKTVTKKASTTKTAAKKSVAKTAPKKTVTKKTTATKARVIKATPKAKVAVAKKATTVKKTNCSKNHKY